MNNDQIKNLLTNPKFWGFLVGLFATLGISYFKDVDPNVLVGAIITIVTVFVGGSAYENGKKQVAAAHVEAASTAALAMRMASVQGTTDAAKNLTPYMMQAPKE